MHLHLHLQDVTIRNLSLALWGGSCPYIAQGTTYPGFWMGRTTVQLAPTTCFTSLLLSFGDTSATPVGHYQVPPLVFSSIKLTVLDDAVAKKGSLQQVGDYLTVRRLCRRQGGKGESRECMHILGYCTSSGACMILLSMHLNIYVGFLKACTMLRMHGEGNRVLCIVAHTSDLGHDHHPSHDAGMLPGGLLPAHTEQMLKYHFSCVCSLHLFT